MTSTLKGQGQVEGNRFTLAPLGTVTFAGSPDGELVLGSATVVANFRVSAVEKFSLAGSGIAGVGSARPLPASGAPVRRQSGVRTGVAVRNVSNEEITVDLTLKDANGVEVANGSTERRVIPPQWSHCRVHR